LTRKRSVLIVDVGNQPLAALAMRLAQLGFHALRAKTAEQALETLADERYDVGVVVLPDDLPVFDLDRALAAFRGSAVLEAPNLIVTGACPDADRRNRLRRAGVDLALWNPVDDHTLRFQLNAALTGEALTLRSRDRQRVPTNWPVRLRSGGRMKPAKIYSLSSRGAFVATSSPSMPKSLVFLTIPLPEDDAIVSAEVVMTNVPGNLAKKNLPIGMGVRFRAVDAEISAALEAYAEERAAQLRL
jgi:CheY-like chemotaxis protein